MQYRSCVALTLGGVYLASSTATVLAQSVKLSGPMAPSPLGSVWEPRFTADGTRAVYLVSGYGGADLFVGPVDGGEPAEALTDLGTTEAVYDFQITQDGERVVYRAGPSSNSRAQLYSVPLDGSQPPVQLSQVQAAGFVYDFLVDLQGNRALYAADQFSDEVVELFSVPIDGSTPAIRISGTMVAGGDVRYDYLDDGVRQGFQITPDGTTAVYVADQETDQVLGLFRVPMDGSVSPIRLDGRNVSWEFNIDPDGRRVVYRTSFLHSIPIDGSSGPQCLGRRHGANSVRITPDGRTVLFRSDGQLFRVPIDGVPHVPHGGVPHIPHAAKAGRIQERVNGPMVAGGFVNPFDLSPDGTRVVYKADQETLGVNELYSVPLFDASAWVKLNGDLGPDGHLGMFQISPDGTRVFFVENSDVYSAPIEGGTAPVLVAPGASSFQVTADGSGLVFQEGPQLFGVPSSGGYAPIQLNLPTIFSNVSGVTLAPVGQRVIYRYNEGQYIAGVEIYSVPADGSQLPVRVNAPLPLGPSNGDVQAFEVTPDGSRVVYLADQRFDSVNELFSVPTSGAVAPVELSDMLHSSGDVYPGFRLSPDASRVFFVSNREFLFHLYGVPIDGSTAPVQLTPYNVRQVFEPFQLTPDGSQAVFLSSAIQEGRVDIFSVPTDGSLQAVWLNGGLLWANVQGDFLITPDGQRVVYRREWLGDFDLHSAPIGPGPEVLLGTRVQVNPAQFALASGGARVLFLSGGNRLYSVPADGSQAALQFSAQAVQFRASLSGTRVAFTHTGGLFSRPVDGSQPDLSLDPAGSGWPVVAGGAVFYNRGGTELWGAAMNGSQGPTLLTPPLVAGGTLGSFAISASQGRAVYAADQEVDGVRELFSVPTDGSRVSTRLNAPFVSGGNVVQFEISLDGGEVVYRADQNQDEVYELFVVPIAGGIPTRLNGPLVAGGDVLSVEVGAGGRVFYLADEDTDGVNELYMSWP